MSQAVEWGVFRAFYESPWQHPILLILVPLALFFFLPGPRGFLFVYLWVFTVETIIDAVVTSSLMPPLGLDLLFVLLGDARIFALMERYSHGGTDKRWLLRVAGLTAMVPAVQAVLLISMPHWFYDIRHTYLAYECLFVVWLLSYRFWLQRSRVIPEVIRAWLDQLTHYALTYYGLWAIADLFILSGADAGYGLRVVPNLLYYALFVPFVWWSAPQELK